MVPPTDIVESVDMDLSEDEDQRKLIYSKIFNNFLCICLTIWRTEGLDVWQRRLSCTIRLANWYKHLN